jgi:hypothetical protein
MKIGGFVDKYTGIIIMLIIMAVFNLPPDTPLLLILIFAYVLILTFYCSEKYPSFYIHSVSNGYAHPILFTDVLGKLAHFINSIIFLILSTAVVSEIIVIITNFLIVPILSISLENLPEISVSWFVAACLLISGPAYLLFFKYIHKLATKQVSNSIIQEKEKL